MTSYPCISQLLPHDEPMILIDQAIDIQHDSIHCQVDIGPKNPFFDTQSKTVPAYVGIEFMAQSIAAWSGYHAMKKGEQPPIGFLLGSRRYTSHCDTFQAGSRLDMYAEQLMEDNGMAVFSARIEIDSQVVASCQLNVYVPSQEKLEEMKTRSQL
ncbi:3-hydroxydecanoyl-ACP dehydratase [Vibrio caribbeanicus]|uniref:3-hydroxydecanoyl-ACP dehydratase n=1 Tax=Vibrio caribbeanicus TaxID=701175 RepID=A0ACC4P0K9_9VIBR|nr:hotdog family protein [Vibrio caribbeanicus]KHD26212.1 3-hydroxydecanoyl-ACP dehydratase [Vibrio caribbeanicus]